MSNNNSAFAAQSSLMAQVGATSALVSQNLPGGSFSNMIGSQYQSLTQAQQIQNQNLNQQQHNQPVSTTVGAIANNFTQQNPNPTSIVANLTSTIAGSMQKVNTNSQVTGQAQAQGQHFQGQLSSTVQSTVTPVQNPNPIQNQIQMSSFLTQQQQNSTVPSTQTSSSLPKSPRGPGVGQGIRVSNQSTNSAASSYGTSAALGQPGSTGSYYSTGGIGPGIGIGMNNMSNNQFNNNMSSESFQNQQQPQANTINGIMPGPVNGQSQTTSGTRVSFSADTKQGSPGLGVGTGQTQSLGSVPVPNINSSSNFGTGQGVQQSFNSTLGTLNGIGIQSNVTTQNNQQGVGLSSNLSNIGVPGLPGPSSQITSTSSTGPGQVLSPRSQAQQIQGSLNQNNTKPISAQPGPINTSTAVTGAAAVKNPSISTTVTGSGPSVTTSNLSSNTTGQSKAKAKVIISKSTGTVSSSTATGKKNTQSTPKSTKIRIPGIAAINRVREKTEKIIAESKAKALAMNQKGPSTLYDFRVRTRTEQALEPGKLKDYIDAPLSAAMSWPPQSAEVKKDLRKYLSSRKIPNKRYTQYDLHISQSASGGNSNSKIDGVYKVVEKTYPVENNEISQSDKENLGPGPVTGNALNNNSIPDNTVTSESVPSSAKKTDTKQKKTLRKIWFAHRTRKIILYYQPKDQRWLFLERKLLPPPPGPQNQIQTQTVTDPVTGQVNQMNYSLPHSSDAGLNALGAALQQQSMTIPGPNTASDGVTNNSVNQNQIQQQDLNQQKKVYGPQQLVFWCNSAVLQPELLKDDVQWYDASGNKVESKIVIKAKQLSLSALQSPRGSDDELNKSTRSAGSAKSTSRSRSRSRSRSKSDHKLDKDADPLAGKSDDELSPSQHLLKEKRKISMDLKNVPILKRHLDEKEELEKKRKRSRRRRAKNSSGYGEGLSLSGTSTSKNKDDILKDLLAQTNVPSSQKVARLRKGLLEDCSKLINQLVNAQSIETRLEQQMNYQGPLSGVLDGVSGVNSRPGIKVGTRCEHPSVQMHKQRHLAEAAKYEEKGPSHLSLAIREYREALRLTPNDERLKTRIILLERKAKQGQNANTGSSNTMPLLRFVSHHNLAIRYWDSGKATLAIKECENAVGILNKHQLSLKGIVTMLDRMIATHQQYRQRESNLINAEYRKPNSLSIVYKLGVLYFDKRMLTKAEQYMVRAETLIREQSNVAVYQKDEDACRVLRQDYDGIRDDLNYLKTFQNRFCTEVPILSDSSSCNKDCNSNTVLPLPSATSKDSVAIEMGLRDSIAPQLLPDFEARFEDSNSDGGYWWQELLQRQDIDWQV